MSRLLLVVLALAIGSILLLSIRRESNSSGIETPKISSVDVPVVDGEVTLKRESDLSRDNNARDPITTSEPERKEEQHPTAEDEQEEEIWEEFEEEDDSKWLARVGMPADTPLALRHGRAGPPDPVVQGDMTLELRLFDSESGEPFSSDVILWHIDAAPNRFWTGGDQDIARSLVGKEGGLFEGLVAGRYRPVVLGEWRHAPHQNEIEVWGDIRVDLFVATPGKREAMLKLTITDQVLASVEAKFDSISTTDHSQSVPPWVNWRSIQPEFSYGFFSSSWGDPDFYSERDWEWLYPNQGLYPLQHLPGDTRGTHFHRDVLLRFNGGTPQELRIANQGHDSERLAPLVFEVVPN